MGGVDIVDMYGGCCDNVISGLVMNQAEKQDMTVIVCFDGTLHGARGAAETNRKYVFSRIIFILVFY